MKRVRNQAQGAIPDPDRLSQIEQIKLMKRELSRDRTADEFAKHKLALEKRIWDAWVTADSHGTDEQRSSVAARYRSLKRSIPGFDVSNVMGGVDTKSIDFDLGDDVDQKDYSTDDGSDDG